MELDRRLGRLSGECALVVPRPHRRAARDDAAISLGAEVGSLGDRYGPGVTVGDGLANCRDVTSGRSPLHVAVLNGGTRAEKMLLEAGALMHVRDALRHTLMYNAALQGHEDVVDPLVQAGANLCGADVEGKFVALAVRKTVHAGKGNEAALEEGGCGCRQRRSVVPWSG